MALTSTYSNGTLTISKATASTEDLNYNANVASLNEEGTEFGSDVTVIDASKITKGLTMNAKGANLNTLTLGKNGADNVTVSGSLTVTTGNGKDNIFVTSDTTSLTITDFDQKNDVIQLGEGISEALPTASFSGANVTLDFANAAGNATIASVTLNNGKDKLITIQNSTGGVIWEQSFQAAGDVEYDVDNNNTGSILKSKAAYIDASARSKALSIEATGNNQQILGGKGNDTVTAGGGVSEIAGGKGNDTFIINPGTNVDLTDYTLGGKETIQLGSGLDTYSYITNGNDVIISFKNKTDATKKATLTIKDGKWDQIAAEKKKLIALVDSDGKEIVTQGFRDPREVVVAKVNKASKTDPTANVFDFADSATTVIMAGQTAAATIPNRDNVDVISFNSSTPASIQAGGGFTNINGGKGKDTLIGAADATAAAKKTGYTNATYENYNFAGGNLYYVVKLDTVYNQTVYVRADLDSSTYAITRVYQVLKNTDSHGNVTYVAPGGNNREATSASPLLKMNASTEATLVSGNELETSDDAKTYIYDFTDVFDGTAYSVDAARPDSTAIQSIFNNLSYIYRFEGSNVALDGGAGNDYLFGGNVGANLYGSAGNDTLRGGKGQTTMVGGAGNDVFLLTGEGTSGDTHVITDYYSGSAATYETIKADATARKKAYGSDKIVVSYDTYKTKAPVARATLTGGTITESGLTLSVAGQAWKDSVVVGTGNEAYTIAGHFNGDSGIADSTDTNVVSYTADYNFSNIKAGDVLTIVDQGITYKQTVEAAADTSVVVSASYLGKVNDAIKFINAADSKKAERLVAGIGTLTIAGGTKVDTIVGNGQTSMHGGNGNDIFVVQSGDIIADYSTTGATGKDKIQVNSLASLANKITYDISSETGAGNSKVYTVTLDNNDVITITTSESGKITEIKNEKGYGLSVSVNDNYFGGDLSVTSTYSNQYGEGGSVQIGGITIQAGTGKAITFQQVTETPVFNAKKGAYLSTKKTTDTMVRTFSSDVKDSVVSGCASTYLEVFAGLDDQVVAIKGGSKAAQIVNSAKHVNSIVGGAKAETISVGRYTEDTGYTDTTITVTSGKGNDVIVWNEDQDVVLTDYTTAKISKGKVSAGDIIMNGDIEILGFDGNDIVLSNLDEGRMTLVGGKDKTLVFANNRYTATDTIGAVAAEEDTFATVSGANPHEYQLAKKTDLFEVSNVKAADAADGTSETWIVNTSAGTKAQTIDFRTVTGNKVATIYGGKGADTIYAGSWKAPSEGAEPDEFHPFSNLVDAGAGNDVVFATGGTGTTLELVTGAGNDVIVFSTDTGVVNVTDYTAGTDKLFFQDGVYISNVASVDAGTIAGGTAKKPTPIEVMNITASINGKAVTFENVKKTTPKLTVVTGTSAVGKTYFSLDYFNDEITIEAKDFAANTAINLAGAKATDVTVAKAAKKVTIEGAQNGAIIGVEAGSKNAITYKGNTYSVATQGATYNGSDGADVYKAGGLNASDTVVLGSGNDSILSGGKAHVVSGIGNNSFVLDATDAYNIDKFSTTDKVVLASTTTLDSVVYNSDTKALVITTKEGENTGTITLNDYTAGNRVSIAQLGTNNKGKETVADLLVRSYGSDTLTLAKGDTSEIIISEKTDNVKKGGSTSVLTKTVTAKDIASAFVISDTTHEVTTFVGGSKNDTIYAFDKADGVVTTLTGGKGNDRFVLTTNNTVAGKVAQYVITDYEAGDIIDFGTDAFSGIADYSPKASLSGDNVLLTDTGVAITVTGGKGKTISFGTTKVSFSDPVDVVLAKNDTLTNWDTANVDESRVLTFDGSKNTKEAITFTAKNAAFKTFVGNKKGTTLTIGSEVTSAVAITPGIGGGTISLSTRAANNSNPVETITYSGGDLTITNFGTTDKLEGITAANVKSAATVAGGGITYTIKNNSVTVNGDGVKLTADPTWTLGDAVDKSKTADSDTFTYTYNKYVEVGGSIGKYTYDTVSTTSTKEAASSLTAPKADGVAAASDYREEDFISYGDTIYSGQEGDSPFASILDSSIAKSADKAAVVSSSSIDFSEVGYDTGDVITPSKDSTKKPQNQ